MVAGLMSIWLNKRWLSMIILSWYLLLLSPADSNPFGLVRDYFRFTRKKKLRPCAMVTQQISITWMTFPGRCILIKPVPSTVLIGEHALDIHNRMAVSIFRSVMLIGCIIGPSKA